MAMERVHIYKADFLLLITAAIWGAAFVAQRMGMDHMGPYLFNASRFALGAVSLLPLIWLRDRKGVKESVFQAGDPVSVLWGGLLAGVLLFAASTLQQVGIIYTTAGKAGFITGLYVVLVPLLGLFWRQNPGAGGWIGACLSAIGLYFLTITSELTIAYGDFLVFLCAIAFALHVLAIGWLAPRIDCIKLSSAQFAVTAVLSFIVALFVEEISWTAIKGALVPILYAGIGSSGIAYTLQVVAQKEAPPAHASIILSLESVFAALAGWAILSETMDDRSILGCFLMFSGMLAAQLWPGRSK
ncbi:MAG: DMT family transporter [Desulfonatronovibrionaceae bacterium]